MEHNELGGDGEGEIEFFKFVDWSICLLCLQVQDIRKCQVSKI